MNISKDSSGAIIMQGNLVVAEIESIHTALEGMLNDTSQTMELDLKAVDEVDTAGLQLLFALKKTIEETGVFHIRDASTAVKEALTLSGFDNYFRG